MQYSKDDKFLIYKFGPIEEEDAVVYGGAVLNENELQVLRIPPKYAVYGKLDLKEF